MKIRRLHRDIDMTTGNILPKVFLFSIPLMLSSVLQLLFNAADVIVVGRFDGQAALAAVGSTGALINLIVNVFFGLSIGANVVIARYLGANRYQEVSKSVHTSIALSLVGGVLLGIFGVSFAGLFLKWMGSPDTVRPLATNYMRIFFIGMPVNMLYNFGAAVLRSVGDTRRPLYYLAIAGVINVLLNLLFVIVFRMGVSGVALATIISQTISAVLVTACLMRSENAIRLDLKKLRIDRSAAIEIAKIGLPAGLQGAFFSLSNVLIQSTINSFGETAMAGNSASANIEGFIYVSMNAIYQASVTFTSQNLGARKYDRVVRTALCCLLAVVIIGVAVGGLALLMQNTLFHIYTDSDQVAAFAKLRLQVIAGSYFICGCMDVLCGCLRGIGDTMTPMLVSIFGSCLFRILWIWLVLPLSYTLPTLYLSYPVSWIITGALHGLFYLRRLRTLKGTLTAA